MAGSEPIAQEEQGQRGMFFIESNGVRIAELTYRKSGESRIVIDHTEVDVGLRGRGVARRLLDAAVAWARENQMKVSATCPYVITQFARDPSFADVNQ